MIYVELGKENDETTEAHILAILDFVSPSHEKHYASFDYASFVYDVIHDTLVCFSTKKLLVPPFIPIDF